MMCEHEKTCLKCKQVFIDEAGIAGEYCGICIIQNQILSLRHLASTAYDRGAAEHAQGTSTSEAWKAVDLLKNELAAANARIAELTAERQRDALDGQAALDEANSRITSYEQQFGEYCKGAKSDVDYWKKRAEKAEAKAKQLIKKLTYNTPSFRDGKCDEELLTIDENEFVPLKSCMCDRLKQAEAQNKRMQAAINRYVIGNIELLDALKAALEGKP